MEISFIILNYRQKGLVKQCLKSIVASRISLSHEIIVVDNNSNDGCLDMIREHFPMVLTIQQTENLGFAAGNNAGIRAAQGKYIAVINPDVILTEGITEKLIKFLEVHPQAGVAGPQLLNPDGSIQDSCRRFPNLLTPILRHTPLSRLPSAKKAVADYQMADFDHTHDRKVEWLFGAFFIIKKSVLDQVGLFDERFFLYYEDLDLCRRVWEKGFEVWYVASAEVIHYHQRLSSRVPVIFFFLSRATRIHIASALKYQAKYLGSKAPRAES